MQDFLKVPLTILDQRYGATLVSLYLYLHIQNIYIQINYFIMYVANGDLFSL